jgi:DNA-binding transcriptional ArsR family regulator
VAGLDAAGIFSTSRFINRAGDNHVTADQLSTTFSALADPTRRAILARLAEGEATVNELAEPFPITLQAVSKHLKVLERAGLIARGRSAQLRPSRLQGEALRRASDWLADYRRYWDESFDRLDEHLREIQKGPTDARDRRGA